MKWSMARAIAVNRAFRPIKEFYFESSTIRDRRYGEHSVFTLRLCFTRCKR